MVAERDEDLLQYWERSVRNVLWGRMLRHELEAALETKPVVLVPIGSVEQHGPACPQDVDIIGSYAVCLRAAQEIEDFSCIVAPPVWFGLAPYNMGWVGTISLGLETAVGLLHDICVSINTHGFTKIILVNGHGGNVPLMGVVATKLSEREIFVGYTSIWDLASEAMVSQCERDGGRISHGGEMETSIQLYLRPSLVDMHRAVSEPFPGLDINQRHPRMQLIELLRETKTGVMGDGTAGSAEKGRVVVNEAAHNLAEMARWFRDTERVAKGYETNGSDR